MYKDLFIKNIVNLRIRKRQIFACIKIANVLRFFRPKKSEPYGR